MSNYRYPEGSIWRKWDLHVHSPASDGFRGTYDQVVQQIIESDCAAIGINDYFTIEGYKELKNKLQSDIEKTILPVVEMRMNNVLANRHSDNSGVRINFHIIFNPFDHEKNIDLVSSIESFIKSINYKKSSGHDSQIGTIYHDRQALLNDVTVDYDEILDKLDKLEVLAGNYLILLPYDEYGGIDEITSKNFPFKPALINRAHIIGSSNAKIISYFRGETKDYFNHFDKRKPCIKGSDSHNYDYPIGHLRNADSAPIDKFCWIKANPTFNGLKQIIREPEDRVYIGSTPPTEELILKNKTKYIDSIELRKKSDSHIEDIWFDDKIILNTSLVSIIGNKGKGKSALIEALGLMGYTKNNIDFSFLTKDKFLRNNLAGNFQATLKWKDGTVYSHDLDYRPSETEPERVKCIPQHYLERICNNLDVNFQEEIDAVIFSHIDYIEKLGTNNLKKLIEYRTKTIDEAIDNEREKIIKINSRLIELEDKEDPNYKQKLDQELELKRNELKSLWETKPTRLRHPTEDKATIQQQQESIRKLDEINQITSQFEINISKIRQEQLDVNSRIENIKFIEGRIIALKDYYAELSTEITEKFKEYLGVQFKDTVKLNVSKALSAAKGKLKDLDDKKGQLKLDLEGQTPKDGQSDIKPGLLKKLEDARKRKKEEQNKLDEPTKNYQISLEKYNEWKSDFESRCAEMRDIQKNIKYINDTLASEIDKYKSNRNDIIMLMFNKFQEKVSIYKEIYKPVIDFIDNEKRKNHFMELDFSPEITLTPDFSDNFLSFIDQGRKGAFQGRIDGRDKLRDILQKYNFTKVADAINFLNEILYTLKTDPSSENYRSMQEQLVKGKDKNSFYAFLFLLRFLKIDYQLRWGDKTLEDLSPGERGTVLLIFYLLIDQSDIPLIIDQPEENLDNESVFHLLVRYIKDAKKRRQIIIVTHNPNLAVVCDAEQIIYCSLDKKNKFKVSYVMGAIEDTGIKAKIIDVLEGTKDAFGNRQEKYEITSYGIHKLKS